SSGPRRPVPIRTRTVPRRRRLRRETFLVSAARFARSWSRGRLVYGRGYTSRLRAVHILKRAERFVEHLMDHHDRMNAEAEESPSHLGHEMSPTSATPMSMEHDHRGMMEQDLRRRFFVVLVLTFPVLALSPTI